MGLTVLDAGVVIGFLDGNDAHHDAAHAAMSDARNRNDRLVLPASAFAEVLVGPSRRGPGAVAGVRSMVEGGPVGIAPLGAGGGAQAAQVRGPPPAPRPPDAPGVAPARPPGGGQA